MAADGVAVPNRGFLRAVAVYLVFILGATLLVGVQAIVALIRGVTNETTALPFVALMGFLIAPIWLMLLNGVRARLAGHADTRVVSMNAIGRVVRMAVAVPMLLYGSLHVVQNVRFEIWTARAWGGAIALLAVGVWVVLDGRRRRIEPT
jgi:hypothetical protein